MAQSEYDGTIHLTSVAHEKKEWGDLVLRLRAGDYISPTVVRLGARCSTQLVHTSGPFPEVRRPTSRNRHFR